MSLKPGITGQPTELLDGAKVNSLTEYTVGSGVSIQGRTNGTAIEAGKVGQVVHGIWQSPAIGVAGALTLIYSLPLTAGVWFIDATIAISASGATWGPDAYIGCDISTVPGTSQYISYTTHGNGTGDRSVKCTKYMVLQGDQTIYIHGRHGMSAVGASSWYHVAAYPKPFAIRIA